MYFDYFLWSLGVNFPLEYGDTFKDYVPSCDSIQEFLQNPIKRHLKVKKSRSLKK